VTPHVGRVSEGCPAAAIVTMLSGMRRRGETIKYKPPSRGVPVDEFAGPHHHGPSHPGWVCHLRAGFRFGSPFLFRSWAIATWTDRWKGVTSIQFPPFEEERPMVPDPRKKKPKKPFPPHGGRKPKKPFPPQGGMRPTKPEKDKQKKSVVEGAAEIGGTLGRTQEVETYRAQLARYRAREPFHLD